MTIFVMHIHTQHCDSCGRDETMSRLYSAEEAQRGARYLPCSTVNPLDPIRKLAVATVHIPVCAACVDSSRAELGAEVYANWQDTLKRKAAQSTAPSTMTGHIARASHKATKPEPSLDDLA